MAQTDGVRRYIEAALALTQITRSRAEEVVRDLIRTGEVESGKAQDWVEDLVRTSRQRSEAFASTVRSEVRRQLSDFGLGDINDLARRVADILEKAGTAARRAGRAGARRPAGRAATKTGGARKTAARKATGAKKTAKKTVKKAGAAKKSAGTRKTTAARKTTARKTTGARKKASGATKAARRRS